MWRWSDPLYSPTKMAPTRRISFALNAQRRALPDRPAFAGYTVSGQAAVAEGAGATTAVDAGPTEHSCGASSKHCHVCTLLLRHASSVFGVVLTAALPSL